MKHSVIFLGHGFSRLVTEKIFLSFCYHFRSRNVLRFCPLPQKGHTKRVTSVCRRLYDSL